MYDAQKRKFVPLLFEKLFANPPLYKCTVRKISRAIYSSSFSQRRINCAVWLRIISLSNCSPAMK